MAGNDMAEVVFNFLKSDSAAATLRGYVQGGATNILEAGDLTEDIIAQAIDARRTAGDNTKALAIAVQDAGEDEIDRIHKNVFGQVYPAESDAASNIVTKLLEGVRPALCKFVHKHMQENRITPKLWSLCEAGNAEALKTCPLWEDNGA